MQLNNYVLFDGRCREAFEFYGQSLGGQIQMIVTHGESPESGQVAPEWRDKIMHVAMAIGNSLLMGCDAPPQFYVEPQGFRVQLNVKTPAEADSAFQKLAENGSICMPIQETFWSPRFGMLVDRFGVPWMINCEAQC
jgi:PhnB protein